jgi:hypothetical protein
MTPIEILHWWALWGIYPTGMADGTVGVGCTEPEPPFAPDAGDIEAVGEFLGTRGARGRIRAMTAASGIEPEEFEGSYLEVKAEQERQFGRRLTRTEDAAALAEGLTRAAVYYGEPSEQTQEGDD